MPDALQTLLCRYQALPSNGADPEHTSMLITAIAELAPWRIMVFDGNGGAVTIDASDTPEAVLNERAWRDMIGAMESLAAARTVQRNMEQGAAH